MSQTNGSQDEPDYSQLYVYAGPELPDIQNMTVYEDDYLPFLGSDPGVHVRIIGSSHHIRLVGDHPRYNEVTSCRPIEMSRDFDPVMMNYDITDMSSQHLKRQIGPYEVSIDIVAFVDGFTPEYVENMDVSYTFGDGESGAPTGVDMMDNGWETVHAYPEFNIDLYTRTEFSRRE